MIRLVTGSSLTTAPASRATIPEAGFSPIPVNQYSSKLWIRTLLFVQQHCRTAVLVRMGRLSR
jgi:hypothetical protein